MIAKTGIYLDYQGSTPTDPKVVEAMLPWFSAKFGNPHGEHSFAWESQGAILQAAAKIAQELDCDEDEIVFTSGATEANNLAILGSTLKADSARRRILVSAIEHKSVLMAAKAAERFGAVVEHVAVDSSGRVRLDDLRAKLGEDVLLISVMAANNEIGCFQPIEEIAAAAHSVGALYHTDATQMLPVAALSFRTSDADLLSLSGHKIYGPKGIGALLIKRGIQSAIEPLVVGGGQQKGLRSGTMPTPLCVGIGRAIELLSEVRQVESLRLRALRDRLYANIRSKVASVEVFGAQDHPGILSLGFVGVDGSHLVEMLQPQLAVSTGSACTSGEIGVSHVLTAIGLPYDDAKRAVRIGVGRFTDEAEVDAAAALIVRAVSSANTVGDKTVGVTESSVA